MSQLDLTTTEYLLASIAQLREENATHRIELDIALKSIKQLHEENTSISNHINEINESVGMIAIKLDMLDRDPKSTLPKVSNQFICANCRYDCKRKCKTQNELSN